MIANNEVISSIIITLHIDNDRDAISCPITVLELRFQPAIWNIIF